MPSSPRVKPPKPIWSSLVNAVRGRRGRRRRAADRPRTGLGGDGRAAAGRAASPSCPGAPLRQRPSAGCGRSRPTAPRRPRSRPGWMRSAPPPGHCSSTSTRAAARRRQARPATPCSPRTPRRRPRSCCRGGCWCPGRAGRSGCPARSASLCAAGTRPPSGSTPYRPWRRPRGTQALVERTAAGAAFEVVRRVELLLDHWGAHPPAELRAGGLGVRELKAAAAHLHVDEPTAALLVEVAAEARLLASRFDEDGNAVFAPTDAFDAWTRSPTAERWSVLAAAWLVTPRLPGLVGAARRRRPVPDGALAGEHQCRSPPRPAAPSSSRSPPSPRARCSPPAPDRPPWSNG